MPDRVAHIEKAKHNETFYAMLGIETSPYKDWVVVGIFYTALHLIDAYLATKNIHPFSHQMRDDWVKKNYELNSVWLDYRDLKEFRMKASYKLHQFTAQELRTDVLPLLESIKKNLLNLQIAI